MSTSYYFNKTLQKNFNDEVKGIVNERRKGGFGVMTEIDRVRLFADLLTAAVVCSDTRSCMGTNGRVSCAAAFWTARLCSVLGFTSVCFYKNHL